jgi:hypothetical protein
LNGTAFAALVLVRTEVVYISARCGAWFGFVGLTTRNNFAEGGQRVLL